MFLSMNTHHHASQYLPCYLQSRSRSCSTFPIGDQNNLSILSDREGHGHKAVVYKSHFPATKAFIQSETPLYT